MKVSNRARRRQRHYQRMHRPGGLNLVSMMDIFTILVFFLMVSSSDVQVLHQNTAVKLPESVAEQMPRDTLTVTVSGFDVLVAGRAVATLEDVAREQGEHVAALKQELDYQAGRGAAPVDSSQGRPITIMADRELPYQLLKKIMSTCVASGYTAISLAVIQKAQERG